MQILARSKPFALPGLGLIASIGRGLDALGDSLVFAREMTEFLGADPETFRREALSRLERMG